MTELLRPVADRTIRYPSGDGISSNRRKTQPIANAQLTREVGILTVGVRKQSSPKKAKSLSQRRFAIDSESCGERFWRLITAVDTSVILDVLTDDPQFGSVSEAALRKAGEQGKLIVCDCVIAEIYPALDSQPHFADFLTDWQLEYSATGIDCAVLAGESFAANTAAAMIQRQLSRRPPCGPGAGSAATFDRELPPFSSAFECSLGVHA